MVKIWTRRVVIGALPFLLLPLFLSACATSAKDSRAHRKSVLHDVMVFNDLKQIDLDGDGTKDIIAVYSTNSNSSGVKVIKFHNDDGEVIFERAFSNPPGVKLMMEGDTPILIVEMTNETTGRKIKDIYRWNGNAFVLTGK